MRRQPEAIGDNSVLAIGARGTDELLPKPLADARPKHLCRGERPSERLYVLLFFFPPRREPRPFAARTTRRAAAPLISSFPAVADLHSPSVSARCVSFQQSTVVQAVEDVVQ